MTSASHSNESGGATGGRTAPSEGDSRRDAVFISVIVPCYREQLGIRNTVDTLLRILQPTERERYEFIFVDDHSDDDTPQILRDVCRRHQSVRAVRLGTNCGSGVSIRVGLEACAGDVAVVLMADLQEGPELVPTLLEKWREGADVVYSIPVSRERGSLFSNAAASLFYALIRRLGSLKPHQDYSAGTRLMDRKAIDYYCRYAPRGHNRSLWMQQQPFSAVYVPYNPPPRQFGKSKWTLRKKIKLAIDSILDVTPSFLTGWVVLGAVLLALGVFGWGALLVRLLLSPATLRETPDLLSVMLLVGASATGVGGLLSMAAGSLGAYLWRIYAGLRNGPEYTVQWKANFGDDDPPSRLGDQS